MSSELKSCPFCGGKAEPYKQEEQDYFATVKKTFFLFGVGCWDCGCQIYGYDTEQEAIAAWNTRAVRTCKCDMGTDYYSGKLDQFFCSECNIGWFVDDGFAKTTKVNYCPNCGARVIQD